MRWSSWPTARPFGTAYLVIYGELPTEQQLVAFHQNIRSKAAIHTGCIITSKVFRAVRASGDPVVDAQLLGAYYPEMSSMTASRTGAF